MMQDYQHELSAIRGLLKENPNGMSVTDISRALKKNKNTVGRYLDILLISGQVDMRTYGMAKVYSLSQRVPLSAMLSYSKELIMVIDADDRIVDINEHFLRILGLERGSAVGKNIGFLHSPDTDIHELLGTIKAVNSEEERTVTFRLKGGSEQIFRTKRIPTVFEDGGKGTTVVLEDITGHILADREIRQSEERFRMMAENIRDGLIIIENGKNVYANKRVVDITGYSVKELMDIDPVLLVAPEDRRDVERRLQDVKAQRLQGFRDDSAWIVRKDGERRCVYSRITLMHHEKSSFAFVILTDVTELKAKEAALRESEQRFRMMAENIRDGLLIIENNLIVFANRRMTEISGFTQEEIAELDFRTIITSDVPHPPGLMEAVAEGEHVTIEKVLATIRPGADMPGEAIFWIKRKDGTKRCIQGNFSAAEHGSVTSIYLTATDITSFAEKERALRDRIASLQELVS